MINKKTTSKTKFIALIVAIFILLINGGLTLINFAKKSISDFYAYESSVSFSNGDFSSPSSGTFPLSPSSWTAKESTDDVVSGIISLDSSISTTDKVTNTFKLDSLPRIYTGMASDEQVLMINAKSSLACMGYQSQTISMSAGNFYVVSFKAYTEVGTVASARLEGYDDTESKFLTIVTDGQWEDYRIYVATKDISALSPNLEFWLGVKKPDSTQTSKGACFFDKVTVTSYDNKTYFEKLLSETQNFVSINEN